MSHQVLLVAACGRGVGLGHLERTLALADALAPRVATAVAVPRDDVIIARVAARGQEPVVLSGDIGERAAMAAHVRQPVALVVDAYDLPLESQRDLRSTTPLAVVDDLAHECDCDLAINPSPGGEALKPRGARAFLGGTAYALMSGTYRAARAARTAHPPQTDRVLVATGAMGFRGIGLQLAAELVAECPATQVTLVVGPDAEIPDTGVQNPRIAIVTSPPTLADLLAEQSLFVGAAGTTALQAACVGVPSVVFPLVTNQRRQAGELAAAGCAVVCTIKDATTVAAWLINDAPMLERMSLAGRNFVDGLGAERVADAVLSLIASRAHA